MSAAPLADRLRAQMAADGPMPVSGYVEAALYDPEGGFYATRGRAGRRGDFLTSPEVGPLFGAVLARAVDGWWDDLGRPHPFPVIEWGAGPGTLVRAVLAAEPEVLAAGALVWHLIERADPQRGMHPDHPAVRSWATLDEAFDAGRGDSEQIIGVVLANELLDNMAFEMAAREPQGWVIKTIGPGSEHGCFTLLPGGLPVDDECAAVLDDLVPDLPDITDSPDPFGVTGVTGVAVPWQPAARAWLDDALSWLGAGRVVVFDYGDSTAALAERGNGWLRTHRDHNSSADWLCNPGSCDITTDVAFDQLQVTRRAQSDSSQADWLRLHGIDDLVEEGRRIWESSAAVGDLASLAARSRVSEAEALLDPAGMGAFRVLEWEVSPRDTVRSDGAI